METKDADETPRLCALCREFEPTGGCAGGHCICAACVTAIVRTTEKLLGVTEIPPLCPLESCTEFLRAPTVERAIAGSRRLARLVRLAPADPEYADVLAPADPEYADVLAAFGATLAAAKVRNIYRVENPALGAVYEACRERMDKEDRRGPGANKKQVFHATTRAAAGSIVREGFDVHRAGTALGARRGDLRRERRHVQPRLQQRGLGQCSSARHSSARRGATRSRPAGSTSSSASSRSSRRT